jgi:hypothetical protein
MAKRHKAKAGAGGGGGEGDEEKEKEKEKARAEEALVRTAYRLQVRAKVLILLRRIRKSDTHHHRLRGMSPLNLSMADVFHIHQSSSQTP